MSPRSLTRQHTEDFSLLFGLPADFEGCNKNGGPQHVFTQNELKWIVRNLTAESFPSCAGLSSNSPRDTATEKRPFFLYFLLFLGVGEKATSTPHTVREMASGGRICALPLCLITRHERLSYLKEE